MSKNVEYFVAISPPKDREEGKQHAEFQKLAHAWCHEHCRDHFGASNKGYYFSYEGDMLKFKEHFGIEW